MENRIDQLYKEKSGDLLRFCESLLHHQTIGGVNAEDIVQKIAIRAWEKRKKLSTHPNLYGWFLNACKKECSMLIRGNIYKTARLGWPVPFAEDMTIEAERDVILRWLAKTEATETLEELTKQLTPLEMMVYQEYYVQDKSAQEAADSLNMKVNTINDAARRIRKRASQLYLGIFLFSFSPIFKFICSILSEGRQGQ